MKNNFLCVNVTVFNLIRLQTALLNCWFISNDWNIILLIHDAYKHFSIFISRWCYLLPVELCLWPGGWAPLTFITVSYSWDHIDWNLNLNKILGFRRTQKENYTCFCLCDWTTPRETVTSSACIKKKTFSNGIAHCTKKDDKEQISKIRKKLWFKNKLTAEGKKRSKDQVHTFHMCSRFNRWQICKVWSQTNAETTTFSEQCLVSTSDLFQNNLIDPNNCY